MRFPHASGMGANLRNTRTGYRKRYLKIDKDNQKEPTNNLNQIIHVLTPSRRFAKNTTTYMKITKAIGKIKKI